MAETTDGFKIADVLTNGDILALARSEAFRLVERDPQLSAADDLNTRSYRDYYDLSWVS